MHRAEELQKYPSLTSLALQYIPQGAGCSCSCSTLQYFTDVAHRTPVGFVVQISEEEVAAEDGVRSLPGDFVYQFAAGGLVHAKNATTMQLDEVSERVCCEPHAVSQESMVTRPRVAAFRRHFWCHQRLDSKRCPRARLCRTQGLAQHTLL